MIEFRSVTHAHDGVPALEDVSLSIADGEFVVLAGPNGSGKTTLLRHCNGLIEPDAGTVLVDGTPVAEDPVGARSTVGLVFQHPRDQFVAETVADDVAFGPENLGLERAEIDRRVETALAAVGLAGRGADRIHSLSGGEQSRLAIAGALAMEPSHLLLDEPFAGVDERARRSIQEHLGALSARGTGIVVASHDLRDLLEPADRVVGLADGRVVLDDSPERARRSLAEIGVRVPPAC